MFYDSLYYLQYSIVPAQAIMLFFFLEMLSETTAAYLATMLVSGQFEASFAFIAIIVSGPLVPMVLGFIPGCRKSPHYNNSLFAQYIIGVLSGTLAISFRIICAFTPNPVRMYFGAISLFFFGIYWPSCLQNGGFTPNKDPEHEGYVDVTHVLENPWVCRLHFQSSLRYPSKRGRAP